MKFTKIVSGHYTFFMNGEKFTTIYCEVVKSWSIYNWCNHLVAGGDTRNEALDNFKNKYDS